MAAQILLVFEIDVFQDFLKFYQRTWNLKNSKTLNFSILLLEIVRVFSGVAFFASKYDCSNPSSF